DVGEEACARNNLNGAFDNPTRQGAFWMWFRWFDRIFTHAPLQCVRRTLSYVTQPCLACLINRARCHFARSNSTEPAMNYMTSNLLYLLPCRCIIGHGFGL